MKLTHYTYFQILSWNHVFKDSEAQRFNWEHPLESNNASELPF